MQTQRHSDPIASMRARLASLDTRLLNLRAMQQDGDSLAARLAEHVDRERGQIRDKLKAAG